MHVTNQNFPKTVKNATEPVENTTGSLWGRPILPSEGKAYEYAVFSYRELIAARYRSGRGTIWYVTNDKWSPTTSRHQGLMRSLMTHVSQSGWGNYWGRVITKELLE